MASIFDRSLIYVTGKGGVGRSTVAGALGLVGRPRAAGARSSARSPSRDGCPACSGASSRGRRSSSWPTACGRRRSIRRPRSRSGCARRSAGRSCGCSAQSSAFQYFVAAAPGARELVTIVKVWELAQRERWKRGAEGYDLVIVDAPASGHGVGMLRTPKTYGDLARIGPIHKQADQVTRFLRDPRRTAYVAVALAEEMPVSETLEVDRALREHVGGGLETIIVNGVYPRRFAKADVERLETAAGNGAPARRARRPARGARRVRVVARPAGPAAAPSARGRRGRGRHPAVPVRARARPRAAGTPVRRAGPQARPRIAGSPRYRGSAESVAPDASGQGIRFELRS